MTEDSDLKKKLGSSRKQKDLEKLAKKYLQERGRNVRITVNFRALGEHCNRCPHLRGGEIEGVRGWNRGVPLYI